MRMIAKCGLAAALVGAAAPSSADPGIWTFLGRREIGGDRGRQVFRIEGGRRFGVVRLCVSRQAVRFHDVEMRFRDGSHHSVRLEFILPNQRCTSDINLRGQRELSELVVTYAAAGLRRRGARVRMDAR